MFRIRHNNRQPEKGNILISEPFLRDVYFQRSVVLLVEHHAKGSMGFVLNKRTALKVNDFFDGFDDAPRIPIYLGGPVLPDRLFFIHSLGHLIPDSVAIGDGLYFDGDFEALRLYLSSGRQAHEKVKFFLGYAGWTERQLADEIAQDSWLVGDSSTAQILAAEGESFWKHSVEAVGGAYLTWINYPRNPILN